LFRQNDKVLRRLGRDVAIYGGADLAFKLLQFAFLPLYAHRLSVGEFGLLALVTVSAALAGVVAGFGVGYAVARFYFDTEIGEEQRPALISTGLVQLIVTGSIVLGACALLLFHAQAPLQRDYGLPLSFLLVALLTVLPDQIAQYSLDTSRLQFAPWRFCAIASVKNVLGLLIGLWLLLAQDMGVLGLLIGNLVAALIAAPLGLWLIRSDLTFRINPAYSRMMLRFGSPFIFTAAAYWIFASMDRWLLAEFGNAVEVGLFSIAFKFASVLTLVIGAFHQAWIPLAMRMAREDPRYRENFATMFDVWFFLLSFLALGVALFAGEALMLLTPEPYWPAAPVLAVSAVAVAISGTTQITTLGLTLEKRTILIALGAWIAAALNVALNIGLIPSFGAVGAAVATLVSYGVLTSFFLIGGQHFHPIPLHYRRLGYSLLVCAAALAAPLLPKAGSLVSAGTALKLTILTVVLFAAFAMRIVPAAFLRQFLPAKGPPE
jgi:O-antigen/teichoic acid export membrane protein